MRVYAEARVLHGLVGDLIVTMAELLPLLAVALHGAYRRTARGFELLLLQLRLQLATENWRKTAFF